MSEINDNNYLYNSNEPDNDGYENNFNVMAFNKNFELMKKRVKEHQKYIDEQRLTDYNTIITPKPIYKTNPLQQIIQIEKTWSGLINDIVTKKSINDIIYTNDRIYYIGLTIVIISLILLLIYQFE